MSKEFKGLVLFQLHPTGGWRVFDTCTMDDEPRQRPSINHPKGHMLLGICGTFRRALRRGTWCQRPHKELVYG